MVIDGIEIVPGRAPFPRNQWYVAAFGSEVTREPMHRMLFGDPVVLFRTESGAPVASFDRCPHRGMRLSNGGKLVGDAIPVDAQQRIPIVGGGIAGLTAAAALGQRGFVVAYFAGTPLPPLTTASNIDPPDQAGGRGRPPVSKE